MSDFVSSYKITNKTSFKGVKTFICPKCRALNPVKFKANIKIYDEEQAYPNLYLSLICGNCNQRFNQSVDEAIDPEIAYAIDSLNFKGYKTDFSCQGHIYKNGSRCSAYIKFAGKLPKEAIDKLPLCWKAEEDEECTTIRCMELEEYPLERRIILLNNWVDSLDNISEIIYKELANSTDIDQRNMTCVNNTYDQYLKVEKSSR